MKIAIGSDHAGFAAKEEVIKFLKEKGYDGPMMIEQYSSDFDKIDEVEQSVKYLKTLIGG